MIILPNLGSRKLFDFSFSYLAYLGLLALLSCCLMLTSCAKGSKSDIYEKLNEQEIYDRGRQNLLESHYNKAIEDFEALEARYPFGPLPEKGQLAIIYAYLQKGDYALATAAAERFIRMYPNHEHIDYVHYLKGLSHFEALYTFAFRRFPIDRALRDPAEARLAFAEFKYLLKQYPNSLYVADAKQRMIFLRNFLAEHELHVADYYLNRGAYLSAANRYVEILENFNGTPSVPLALNRMYTAYRALGMDVLADQSKQVLIENFGSNPK